MARAKKKKAKAPAAKAKTRAAAAPKAVAKVRAKAKPATKAKPAAKTKAAAKAKPAAKTKAAAKAKPAAKTRAAAKAAPAAKVKAAPAAKLKTVAKVVLAATLKAVAKVASAVSPATDGRPGVGAAMPPFSLPDEDGGTVSSAALAGAPYVLYFYPKDDTPGCTREACGFRDDLSRFEALGVRVIGVSPDKSESHAKFRTKYSLPFTLLADTERSLVNALGVWVKKQNYGREYMGVERSTFLVDEAGKIAKVWHGVKVDGHVAKVLEAASAL